MTRTVAAPDATAGSKSTLEEDSLALYLCGAGLYLYSLVYLAALFAAMVLEART